MLKVCLTYDHTKWLLALQTWRPTNDTDVMNSYHVKLTCFSPPFNHLSPAFIISGHDYRKTVIILGALWSHVWHLFTTGTWLPFWSALRSSMWRSRRSCSLFPICRSTSWNSRAFCGGIQTWQCPQSICSLWCRMGPLQPLKDLCPHRARIHSYTILRGSWRWIKITRVIMRLWPMLLQPDFTCWYL